MIIAVVGSGGKTSLIRQLAAQYRQEGKTVLITTTTHMYIEADTLLTDSGWTLPGYRLAVYDSQGLAYCAEYLSNLALTTDADETNRNPQIDGTEIHWEA